jgi:alkylated DNA repair dioxygenase AlkB
MNQQLHLWHWDTSPPLTHPFNLVTLPLPDADIQLYESFWPPEASDRGFTQLLQETPWRQETAHLFQRSIPIPRLTAWYGDRGKTYAYSGIEMQPEPWTTTLLELKTAIETVVSASFNSVLLNLYRTGQDSVGWHSDDEPELGRNPIIASVSLGATRRFSLKHKRRKDLNPVHLDLSHGSLLLMQGPTQHNWVHQVPKTTKPIEPRINLTFRTIF